MNDFDGFVLAGGASSRMGENKADLILGGKTFIERAAFALSAVANRIFVVGNLKGNSHELPILPDEFLVKNNEQKRGAIIGLHTALANTKTDWAAVLACDLPFASGELFKKLATLDRRSFDAVVSLQKDLRAQPLCALYRRDACLPVVEAILDDGDDWSLRNLLRRVKTRFVGFDEVSDLPNAELLFFNVNTPEDYAAAQAALAKTL